MQNQACAVDLNGKESDMEANARMLSDLYQKIYRIGRWRVGSFNQYGFIVEGYGISVDIAMLGINKNLFGVDISATGGSKVMSTITAFQNAQAQTHLLALLSVYESAWPYLREALEKSGIHAYERMRHHLDRKVEEMYASRN